MSESMRNIKELADSLAEVHIPRWNELPEIELYSDQVVSYIEQYLSKMLGSESKFITAAMIHNYVKLGLMPKPEKKRYNRTQVAYLITITILKQVLEIGNIKLGIVLRVNKSNESEAYNHFCDELEYAVKVMAAEIFDQPYERKSIGNDSYAIRMAAYAFVCKMLTQTTIKFSSYKERV